ncbi:helix-turn-helix transcriptional regulator [Streptomyces sp. A3M-1-3]|uniref:helix-turn-helix domain-containing protein n=1 Tax=Streptomyces sp. A3M-1-3 TaxID=2962044 RepID=UPI0020B86546|nr:helix-turn-helix transcriptional regulator [Streptomyces sp. A3M-1-3]MCP3821650.1 helix-turn-helix transcriptional regulator [Streptomyces sp. A3M-1-3]
MYLPACLGDFLRAQRRRVRPEDIGLSTSAARRRVPGLRREELARLAGISPDYYARIEQGRARRVSRSVLEALAGALLLDGVQRAHLYWLAQRATPSPPGSGMRRIATSLTALPVVVIDRRLNVIEWNPPGRALLAWHLRDSPAEPGRRTGTGPRQGTGLRTGAGLRPNLARMLFLDPRTRSLFGRWHQEAAHVVARLRHAAREHPQDHDLTALIADLVLDSPEFAELWRRPAPAGAEHPDAGDPTRFEHPLAGRLTLSAAVLECCDGSGERAVVFSAEPGSASQRALELILARLPGRPQCNVR